MKKNTFKSLVLFGLLGTLGGAVLTSCGNGISTTDKEAAACTTASCYLAPITAAEWAAAEADMLTMEMEKINASNSSGTRDAFEFRWKDKTGTRVYQGHTNGPTFIAGKPYVINFINPVGTNNNDQDHYFTAYTGADKSLPDFYKAIAVEKVVTPEMIYKTPYIVDFELNKPENNDNVAGNPRQTEAKIYFVPVRSGSYEIVCKDGGHSQQTDHTGMVTTIQITSGIDSYPDFELDSGVDPTVWIDDSNIAPNRRLNSGSNSTPDNAKFPWGTAINTVSATCHGVETAPGTGVADYTGCHCNGAVAAGLVSSTNYDAGTSTGLGMSCSLAPTNIELNEASGEVSITGAPIFKTDLKSNSVAGTAYTKAARYQLRFQKASGDTGNYVVSGEFFKKLIVRKIHDRHVQFKPVYLDSMEFLTGASANNVDAANDVYAQPGAFEVDLYFIADAQYSITNGSATGGGVTTSLPVDVSIGTALPKTTNFTLSPYTP